MAHMKLFHTMTFLLAIIACHEILLTEGRQLKSMKKQEDHPIEVGRNMGKYDSRNINTQKTPTRKEYDVQVTSEDDNHSVEHSVVRKKETFPPPSTQSLGFSAVSESIDDFRPTTPGNSPGIGHSDTERNVEIQSNEEGKGPGHSPGIGHSFQNKKAEPNA